MERDTVPSFFVLFRKIKEISYKSLKIRHKQKLIN